jgi:hypothetical protein
LSQRTDSLGPAARLLRLLGGKWISAALSAAATLGVPDALARGALSLDELAGETETDPASLERLLRVLQGEDLVRLNSEARFEITEDGRALCSDQLGDLARYVGAPIGWDPWARLPEAVRTGTAGFESRYGSPLFDYLDDSQNAGEASLYHAAIDSFSRAESRALAEAFDFADARRIADIGGGRGALLVDVLTRWPHLQGVLLERPAAVAEAKMLFETSGIASRCETQTADFFDDLPRDVDVCILKHIVHSWDDETSEKLFRRSAAAVGPNGRVLVIEGVLLPGGRPNLTSLLDLEMLVLCGPGHERTKPEMRRLLSRSGLRLEHNVELTESAYLFVTRPKPDA